MRRAHELGSATGLEPVNPITRAVGGEAEASVSVADHLLLLLLAAG